MGFQERLAEHMRTIHMCAYLSVGTPSIDANMYYCTRFFASDPVVYLCHLDGELKEYLAVSEMELERASEHSRVENVVAFSEIGGERWSLREVVSGLCRRAGIRRVCVPEELPVGIADSLRARGIVLDVRKSPFSALRRTKEPHEIDCIRRCAHVCERACERAIQMIADSSVSPEGHLVYEGEILTSERLREEIDVVLLKGHCEAVEGTVVAGGPRSSMPHWMGEGELRADEPIVLDVFPRHRECRYFSDLTRTVLRVHKGGEKVERIKRMHAAVLDAHTRGISLMRHGVRASEVHEHVRHAIIEHGFDAPPSGSRATEGFIHSTGHGVGLEIHEEPSIGTSDGVLERGMVATVEPGLYYRGVGGVRIEDTVVVGEDGGKSLFTISRELVV
ncbi:M24 family metallopeptidase [Methermicoccus shengliensis]|uniref:Aminopeptidase P family protein n=1 Tax=Methermicoccus shengliensis TaxID=660064 RepID=A0A832RY42_9EURY|nr:Xaa-Pro peptidase family protein [Methermicoccus shengliensis]KUK04953.1 MAG: Peptidase M24 [Euryarchaeota archaeon 55_53]KUK30888.1 MAG: Peptidase M24 [Methanosarcinales archeaon 56_1174]MDI3487651.1 Xaa-Pro aminopeptidase [Methanosarcinales archaeon]MDN5294984.1 Xaa-Pro aminopeptidase [Methanosarcinales archaeon]HIH69989.1 aminopeptidase P family protein [Methermicoccus shengliensis]